jgi:uncharacterized zinc-type alcohol dehydrogenase-like protein
LQAFSSKRIKGACMQNVIGYGANQSQELKAKKFIRKDSGPGDVELDLLYCGVCHSDIHQARNDWGNTVWPCVPGHEVVGKVSKVGQEVKNFKVGDLVAVGCMIDSCGTCYSCREGEEQYCESETGFLGTYNGTLTPSGQNSYGGYSNKLTVKEHFLLKIPKGISPEVAGPILCAGVTTYSPLKHWEIKKGMKIGVVGFGGLGHMASQIANAMGAEVTVITTSPQKKEDALSRGATTVIISSDKEQMKEAENSLQFILNTVPERHDIAPYFNLLERDGVMVIVGVLVPEPEWDPTKFIMHRRSLAGSLIGGIKETAEVLDFCQKHKIFPTVELINANQINEAFEKVINKKARYRYVIDLSSLAKEKLDQLEEIPSVNHLLENRQTEKDERRPMQ